MTSAHAVFLAEKIIQNDLGLVEPLLTLLHAFRFARGPLDEAMMDTVIRSVFAKSDHIELCVQEVVNECLAKLEKSESVAAA